MKQPLASMIILCLFSCTTPVRHYITPAGKSDTLSTSEKQITASTVHKEASVLSQTIPVDQWPGEVFYVLPKQQLFQNAGYNLFSCPKGSCTTATIDSSWELPNHRIRCSALSGATMTVTKVTQVDSKWAVTFALPQKDKQVFARTHQQAIAEVIHAKDLPAAVERWKGTHVFSRRGVISSFSDSKHTSIKSYRVNILDSLRVDDVVWGVTPIPVKPIWLMVTSVATGKEGFLPVRISWTNTLASKIREEEPWREDIFEQDPRTLYTWDENTWEVINNHRVIVEMTPEQVELSWGAPLEVLHESDSTIKLIYPSHELTFFEGKCTAITPRQ